MKIFNWLHRRFNSRENAKKNGDIAADDKQFEDRCSVLERWRGGILTIGTFGYDPLKEEGEQINDDVCNYLYEEDEGLEMEEYDETSDSEEEVEEKPQLVYECDEEEDLMEMKMEEHRREEFGFEYVMMEKKARTTLADLFNADSDDTKKQPFVKGDIFNDKPRCKKKLMLEDARPIRKLHHLMRRMLKRKIHPDISDRVPVARKCDNNDHASLLPTQDAII